MDDKKMKLNRYADIIPLRETFVGNEEYYINANYMGDKLQYIAT